MSNDKTLIEKEKEAWSEALSKLLPSMDKPNREEVAKKLKMTERTVYAYLSGEVADATTAKKIWRHCKLNIEQREMELSKIAS